MTQLQILLDQAESNRDEFDRSIWFFQNARGFTTKSFSIVVLKLQNIGDESFELATKV